MQLDDVGGRGSEAPNSLKVRRAKPFRNKPRTAEAAAAQVEQKNDEPRRREEPEALQLRGGAFRRVRVLQPDGQIRGGFGPQRQNQEGGQREHEPAQPRRARAQDRGETAEQREEGKGVTAED